MFRNIRKSVSGMLGLIVIVIYILLAIFADIISPYLPDQQDLANKELPVAWMEGGSPDHLLGTDQLGRDMLSRLIYGSRVSILIAMGGTALAGVIGFIAGALAGYYGGIVDSVIGRLMDINLAFPFILLGIFVVAVLGAGVDKIIFIAGITGWVRFARVVRGEILSIKEMEYVEAIRSLGGRDFRIIVKHILPNLVSPLIIIATLDLAKVILMEASLSYLGMGVPPQVPTWGRMLAESNSYLQSSPHMVILPGITISLLVLGVNLFGDWLRDYMDPKLDTN